MKRFAATALALALAAAPAAEAQTIFARPGGGTLTALVGQSFDVPVIVDMSTHPAQLGAFAMRLTWDPAVLQFVTGMPGTFGSVTISVDSAQQGILRLAGANPAGQGGTSITAAVGRFVPLLAATTTLDLQVTQLFAAGTFADLLPALNVAPALFCPALGRYGDIDADGNANSRDALIALSNAVGLSVAPFNVALGDVDTDGNTNARDALIILSGAVGLDVSAYRVMMTAGGACSSGPPVVLVVEPGLPGDLLVGQDLLFEARAADAGGALQAVTDVAWLSSNTRVLGVLGNGQAVARDTGTADVIAIRDGRDTARVTLQVVPRRTVHVVASTAAGAVNRIGTAALPFATIGEATTLALDGDTIQVRVGRYTGPTGVNRSLVIRGDTLPDGTRPLLAGSGQTAPAGLYLSAPGTVKVEHLAFDDMPGAITTFGGGRLELDGVRVGRVQYGVYVQADLRALIVRRSVFSGAIQGSGNGIEAYLARVDTVLIEDSEFGDFGSWGVQLGRFDRLDVLRSTFRDQYDGLRAGTGDTLNRSGDVAILQSRFLRHYGDGVHLQAVGNVAIHDSRFELLQYDPGVNVSGARTVRLSRDTIVAVETGSSRWLDVDYADSVLLDSLDGHMLDADGYTYNVPYVRLTRSAFREIRGSYVLQVYFGVPQGGGVLVMDSVQMTGAANCAQCGTGIYAANTRTTVDRLTAVNLFNGVETTGDSSLTVTRSRFQSVYRPVSSYGNTGYPGGATVTQSTFLDWSDEAIVVGGGYLTADSNTFDRGFTAIVRQASGSSSAPVTVTRNRIANVSDGIQVTMEDSSRTSIIADNVLTGVAGTGIELAGDMTPDTIQSRFEVLRNSVSCAGSGASQGVEVVEAHALVADNVFACRSGVEVRGGGYGTSAARRDSVLRNTITLQREGPQQGEGIRLLDNLRSYVYGNVITGDSTVWSGGGILTQQFNCSSCSIVAVIDSNLVRQVGGPGIRISRADSVTVTRNQVLDVVLFTGTAGIDLDGAYVSQHARIAGNEVRRTRSTTASYGFGINIFNYDVGTADVDSNLVSDNLRGMYLDAFYGGTVTVTRNRIRRSLQEGVQIGNSGVGLSITQNNFFQNRLGMRSFYGPVAAVNNWWNDPLGPACPVGGPCSGGPAADSVDANVTWIPHATTEFTFTPPNAAPPAFRPAPPIAALRAAPSGMTAGPRRAAPTRPLAERLAERRAAREAAMARHAADRAEDAAEHERRLRAQQERRP